jgi:hypothetical protein
MKKYLNISFYYAIAAMVGGVFYREFTKWNDFTGVTALGKVHAHLFLLCMFVFLLRRAVFIEVWNSPVSEELPCVSLRLYNIGVPLTAVMLLVRGITQVLSTPLSAGADAAISGLAGIGHILTGAGLVLLLVSLKKAVKD